MRYGRRPPTPSTLRPRPTSAPREQAIVAALAKAWFLATESALQRRLVSEMLGGAETLVSLAGDRLRVGAGNELDVTQARVNLQSFRDTALQIDFALAQSRRALEVLLGRYPAAEIELPVDAAGAAADRRPPACRRSCSSGDPTSSPPSAASPPHSRASARRAPRACRRSR